MPDHRLSDPEQADLDYEQAIFNVNDLQILTLMAPEA